MTTLITVRHNFETAHRLPFLGGKCENLHGHSWWAEFGITNLRHDLGVDKDGIAVEYGAVKARVRGFIDNYLDHGCMLGVKDALLPVLLAEDSKVFVFGDVGLLKGADHLHIQPTESFLLPAEDRTYKTLPWPTVEAVAQMLCDKVQKDLNAYFSPGTLYVVHVKVQETHVNGVTFGND